MQASEALVQQRFCVRRAFVLRLMLFAIFELQCFVKNVLLKSRPNAKPQPVMRHFIEI
jgi:hypothetical protein